MSTTTILSPLLLLSLALSTGSLVSTSPLLLQARHTVFPSSLLAQKSLLFYLRREK